jgi:hypothetical protein
LSLSPPSSTSTFWGSSRVAARCLLLFLGCRCSLYLQFCKTEFAVCTLPLSRASCLFSMKIQVGFAPPHPTPR